MIEAISPVVRDHTLIVDLSRLKGPGLKFASKYLVQGHYVGAIPVLAAESLSDGRFGIEAAQADLFKQSLFCIMPSPKADKKAVETAVNLGRILGASPFFIDSMEYDSLVQGLETAPGLLAAAMFRAVKNSSGWRDMLKFAGLQFSLSTGSLETPDLVDLAFHDKIATIHWIDEVINEMREVRRWIADGDKERATLLLDELAHEREIWLLERQRNDWNEIESTDYSGIGVMAQLIGIRTGKKDKKK
jgi:prephenate dehydrogenase